MVRSIHKINITFISIIAILSLVLASASMDAPVNAVSNDVNLNVNLTEVLTVSITNPASWASGTTDTLLRNKVTVSALTNNQYGATVSMYAAGTTLNNTSSYDSTKAATYIDTLDADTYTYGTFPSDAWGYSVTDSDSGTASASYLPMATSASPITLIDRVHGTIGSTHTKDVYFGAKASNAKQSGTYAQTVYFAAVTGVIDTGNPAVPSNPSNDNPANGVATYDSSKGRTTYTQRTSTSTGNTDSVTGDTSTTNTQVSNGNTVSSYANAAGVSTSSNGYSPLITALVAIAGVTAVIGAAFLVLAKRHKNTDEE